MKCTRFDMWQQQRASARHVGVPHRNLRRREILPISSDFWNKLLQLPLNLHWPSHRVNHACQLFAQDNSYTRHLAKILIHRSWCLQEYISASDASNDVYDKAVNAVYISSVFLKYLIENAKDDNLVELYLSLDENEPIPKDFVQGHIRCGSTLIQ
nr:hypothetical protein CFP56_66758 [Quercus suber]